MPDNNNEQKTPAPLISLRRSFQLRTPSLVVLVTGMWLAAGVFGLLKIIRPLAGSNTAWAYLMAGLLMLPTTLSYFELRSWIGLSGGSYRLIRTAERNSLTFLAGWAYILGWGCISALLVQTFAYYAGRLLEVTLAWQIGEIWLIAFLLGFFAVTNILGLRLPWRLGVWIAGSTAVGVIVLIVLLAGHVAADPTHILARASGGRSFFGAVMALIAGLWVIELASETGERRKRGPGHMLLLLLAGPVLAALLALMGRWAAVSPLTMEALAVAALPETGEVGVLLVGALVSAIAWQVLALLMLRRFQVIGLDGWLPGWLLRPPFHFKMPVMLILFQTFLTPAALLLSIGLTKLPGRTANVTLNLAYGAALAFLLLQIGVNIAAIILGNHPRAAHRSFRLPLYPAIQGTGVAINTLLLFAAPWPIIGLGAVWFGLGALVYWQGGLERMRTSQLGVTVFQDTRRYPDITSDYPVIVPVANPDTALDLVAFGAAVARRHTGHVVVVQVIRVPEQLPLDSGRVQAQQQLDLLERALEAGQQFGVPIEGITRLSRSISQGILDTIAEEAAELVVMGWNAREIGRGQRGLGDVLDEVLENAPCHVVVLRGRWPDDLSRVLVPVAGGPHAPFAAELALDLTARSGGEVTLLHVARQADGRSALEQGEALVENVRADLAEPERVVPRVVMALSPLPGILDSAQDQEAVFLGASERGLLDHQLFGQLPLQLAQETDTLLALVRSYTGLTGYVARQAWSSVSDLLPTLRAEERTELSRRMQIAAQPSVNYFVLITLSAMIATLGLLLNSPAVIIGAMLVAPLMSPFVAEAMGIVSGDVRTMSTALTAILQGVLAAIFIAIVTALISPLTEATPEVLARTRPNLLDLMVALVSGIAGAYAIARKEVGEALPGVAIAAALMPPLCTIGIGVALGSAAIALGALLLFVTNLVAIVFASAVTFLLLGVRPPRLPERQRRLRQGLAITIISLVVISIPLGIVLFRTAQRGQIEKQALAVFEETMAGMETARLADFEVELGWRSVTVTGTLYASEDLSAVDLQALDAALEEQLNRAVTVRLFAIQGTMLDSSTPAP